MWKSLHDIVPTMEALYKKKICSGPLCPICQEEVESSIHLLARCQWVQQVWYFSPLCLDMRIIAGETVRDWWCSLLDKWKGESNPLNLWAAVGAIIWRVWKCRNDLVFNGIGTRPDVVRVEWLIWMRSPT